MIWSQKAQNGLTSEKADWLRHDREKITAANRWHATTQKEARNDEPAKKARQGSTESQARQNERQAKSVAATAQEGNGLLIEC